MERATPEKTSAVHFLRFELTPGMAADLKNGAALLAGVDHPVEAHSVEISPAMHESLIADLD